MARLRIGMLMLTAALALAVSCTWSAPSNLLLNGDFAADSDGDGTADHWRYSGDDTVAVTWARDLAPGGGYAQKLTCTRFTGHGPASHAMLAQEDTLSLKKGHWYLLSFLAKGKLPTGVVSVAIRQTDPWEDVGLSEVFRVRPEWRRQEFRFRANRDISTHIRLQIWYTETGTLWISDARVSEVEGALAAQRYTEVVPSLGSKNLLPNGSFECGASGWGTISRGVYWGESGLSTLFGRIDGETAAIHAHSFRIDLDRVTAPVLAADYFQAVHFPVLDPLLANRGWITVKPGRAYTFSASVKSDPDDTPCTMVVEQAFQGTLRREVTARRDWQRMSFTFRPEAEQVFVGLGPDLRDSKLPKATLWVDAVQLEEGEQATYYEPRWVLEIGLEWERSGHLFSSPEEARVVVTASNASDASRAVHVQAKVTDFFNREVSTPQCDLRVPARSSVRRTLPLGVTEKGFYRFTLASDGAPVIPVNAERFGVIGPCLDADGIFGMNHAYPSDVLLRLSKEFGLTWFRDWSMKWQEVEPEKGHFHFAETDYQIDRVRNQGLNVLGLLPFPSSTWSSSAPADLKPSHDMGEYARLAYKPRDLSEFGDYVRATVRHYAGRVRVWEILNEPLYTGYAVPMETGHTIDDYVALLKTAYQAIKEVDPRAFVVGGVAADPGTMGAQLIASGAFNWLDAVNVHTYPVLRAPETYLPDLTALNEALAASGHPKPVYFTEGSYYGDDDLPTEPFTAGDSLMRPLDSELECASYQTRFDIILLSQNVRKIIYHSGTPGSLNRPEVGGIFFEWDGAPRKMAVTQSTLTALLGPQPEYLGTVWGGDAPRSFAFHGRDNTVVAVWDEKESGRFLTPRPGARLLNIVGTPVKSARVRLDGTPVYITIPGSLTLDQVRASLRDWLR